MDKNEVIVNTTIQKNEVTLMYLYLQNRTKLTDLKNELTSWEKWEGGIDWEVEIDMYTLLYLKQISNRDQLCSVLSNNLNGKRILKKNRYMYM